MKALKEVKKILLIKFGAIGDIVHSTIIPYAIKFFNPNIEIHYLTLPMYSPMLENCPHIDKVIDYNKKIFKTIKMLKSEKYDITFALNNTIPILLLSTLIGSKKVCFRSNKGISWVENYFNTAKEVLTDIEIPDRLYFKNSDEFQQKVSEMYKQYPKPHIIFSPGKLENNQRQGRVWNIKKWEGLSKELLKIYGGTIFVIGSKREYSYHKQLKNENIIILSGQSKLKETCEILAQSDLVISGDSGPAHIASAYNKKVISLLGSTSPDKIKPYGENGHFIEPKNECKYCWNKTCKHLKKSDLYCPCIESIEITDVMNYIRENDLI